ncbi:hypothetical protein QJQ45_015966 [Haematococcus lacustris]|nr:hypothetical protein QJQ45_015966 [Haematococcus lacustris]
MRSTSSCSLPPLVATTCTHQAQLRVRDTPVSTGKLAKQGFQSEKMVETDGVIVYVHYTRPLPTPRAPPSAAGPQGCGIQLARWKGQVKHASGLNNARRDTEQWLAPIKPHLQHLAASSAGTSLVANLKHITVTLATWDAVWEVYLDPKWARQRLRLYGAQDRALEQIFKKLWEDMAEASMERHGRAKQLVVFFGADSFGTGGGWGVDAVLRACYKVVCRPRGTDQRRGRVVLVDEHRTTRVSSATNGKQPCEEELDHEQPTRRADWKPPAGQVDLRLLRPAWSQQRDQPVRGLIQEASQPAASEPGPSTPPPAKRIKRTEAEQAAEPSQPIKGTGKGHGKAAKAKPAPQPCRRLDRDCNAALNMQRIGESRWRPLELCWWPEQGKLPAKGKEYPGLGYKRLRDKPPMTQQHGRAVLGNLLLGLMLRSFFGIHVAANEAHTRPSASVAAVLAAHADLRARLEAVPRYRSDANRVDTVGSWRQQSAICSRSSSLEGSRKSCFISSRMMHATPRVSLQHPMLAALPSGTGHCRQAIRSAWSVRIATAHKAALLRRRRPTQAALDSCQLSSWLPVPCATWVLASSGAALVADSTGLTYNPAGGEDFIKNAAGVAYILLVSVFLYRVLTRRAQRAKEQRIGGPPDVDAPPSVFAQLRAKLSAGAAQQQAQQREAGPLDAFLFSGGCNERGTPQAHCSTCLEHKPNSSLFAKAGGGGGAVTCEAELAQHAKSKAHSEAIGMAQRAGGGASSIKAAAKAATTTVVQGTYRCMVLAALFMVLGAAQAGLLAAGMYVFSSKMQLVLEDTSMPDAYTARNISITVRTILLGLSWLATFIFAANSIGLSALTVQWLLFPDSVNSEEERREQAAARRAAAEAAGPQLPKVTVSSKSDELMKAFTSAERLGRKDNSSLTTALTKDESGDTVSMDARNTS